MLYWWFSLPAYDKWTCEEERFLRENWGSMSSRAIASHLGRSRGAIDSRAVRLGLLSGFGVISDQVAVQARDESHSVDEGGTGLVGVGVGHHTPSIPRVAEFLIAFRPYCPPGYHRNWHEQIRALLSWLAQYFGCSAIYEYKLPYRDESGLKSGRIGLVWVNGNCMVGAFEIDPDYRFKSIYKLKQVNAQMRFQISGGMVYSRDHYDKEHLASVYGVVNVRVKSTDELELHLESVRNVRRIVGSMELPESHKY